MVKMGEWKCRVVSGRRSVQPQFHQWGGVEAWKSHELHPAAACLQGPHGLYPGVEQGGAHALQRYGREVVVVAEVAQKHVAQRAGGKRGHE